MASLRIHLLGRCEAEVDGTLIPASAWRRRRAADLLKLVVLAPGRALPREQVMDALWPDADPEQAANSLHRALYDLRQVLGGPYVRPDKGVVRLDDAWVDMEEFLALCDAGDAASLASAVALYRGDLCPDDPYADNLEARRQAVRRRFADACVRLARHRVASGDPSGAAQVLHRLLEVDPEHQEARRLMVQTSAPPSPRRAETEGARAIRRLLGTAEPPPVRGRAAEAAAITAFVRSEGGALFITGEAGVGKTRLAAEAIRAAADRGYAVLAGVALEAHAGASYGPFIEMWTDRARAEGRSGADHPFANLLPAADADPQTERLRLFLSVERSLDVLAGERPALIVVDDLHQADDSSLDLMHHLARASRTRPLHLLCTCRDGALAPGTAVHRLFARLHRERLASRLQLERLDEESSREQLEDLIGAEQAAALAPRIFALCGGNPFYTEELAAGGRSGATAVPAELTETVRDRVAALGADAESLLVAAAAAGERFGFEEAAAASGLPVERALAALERAQRDRLLEENDPGYRFRHALTREAIYGALTRARRQHLHGLIGESLERQGAPPEKLAQHFRAAGALGRALPHLIAAGRLAAQRSGLRETAAFFEEALATMDALGRKSDPERFEIESQLGRVHLELGDLDEAARHHDAAAAVAADASTRAHARRGAALAMIVGGRLGDATTRLEAAIAEIGGPAAELPGMVPLHHSLALIQWCMGQFAQAQSLALQSLHAAERHGDRRGEIRACELLLLCCHGLGDWRGGLEWEHRRAALAGPRLEVGELFDVHLCLWEMFVHDPTARPRAREMLAATEAEAQRQGLPRIRALCHWARGTLDSYEQRGEEAEQSLRSAAELFRQSGATSGEAASLVRLGLLLTTLGRLEESRAVLHDALFVAERATMRSHVLLRLYAALASNHLAAGSPEAARDAIRDGLATQERWGRCVGCSRYLDAAAAAIDPAIAAAALAEQRAGV
jgi:DNA-binding SARP family transcriptional activator/tetratricopeptide (TPR) repeat protein